MTFIVGVAPGFGHAILVSDLRVTFADGREKDCLQKIYPVGRFVMGGFSGSVRIGFALLEILRRESLRMKPGNAWVLDVVVNTWLPRLARRVFSVFPEEERRLGSSIILAAAHPTKNCGSAPWPWTGIYRLCSPRFEPEKAGHRQVIGIGIGAGREEYMRALAESVDDDGFLQAVTAGPWAQASWLQRAVEGEVARSPLPGISGQFQIGLVTRSPSMEEAFIVLNKESTTYHPDGSIVETRLPPLAVGYRQFCDVCKQLGLPSASAVCPGLLLPPGILSLRNLPV